MQICNPQPQQYVAITLKSISVGSRSCECNVNDVMAEDGNLVSYVKDMPFYVVDAQGHPGTRKRL